LRGKVEMKRYLDKAFCSSGAAEGNPIKEILSQERQN